MEDDSQNPDLGTTETYGPKMALEMSQISQHKLQRTRAREWAKELTFIIYDDEDDDGQQDNEEELLKRAIQLSLEDEDAVSVEQDGNAPKGKHDGQVVQLEPEDEDPELQEVMQSHGHIHERSTSPISPRQEKESCEDCQGLPYFPEGKPKKFRLVKSPCQHFLAVSYCWPKDANDHPIETPQTYQFRRLNPDGSSSVPICRPPDHIIDRAVEYARKIGIRQIWIDQVCLPQDGSEEHQLGIQAIDLVYQRAYGCVGLFESIIPEQRYLDAIWNVLNWTINDITPDQSNIPDNIVFDLLQFLEILVKDQWNSRAWILQEAFAAGQKMMITIRTAPNVRFREEPQLLAAPQLLPECFNFVLDEIHTIVNVSRNFLQPRRRLIDYSEYHPTTLKLLSSLEDMHPRQTPYGSFMNDLSLTAGTNFGTRKVCNAAVALTYLRNRKNWPPSDRLAIVANICDYDVRLDTREMHKFSSLSVAYFTLALMNGDLSLLNPDMYESEGVIASSQEYLWFPPFKTILPEIAARNLQPGNSICLRLPNFFHLIEQGLKCPAVLWKVNERIDLAVIREKWTSAWNSLRTYKVDILPFEGESKEDHSIRMKQIDVYTREHWDSVKEDLTDEFLLTQNLIIKGYFSQMRGYEPDPRGRSVISNIVIDILQHLFESGYGSLADSIWHSIRMDAVKLSQKDEEMELPDKVEDLLAEKELLKEPWGLMKFDINDQDSFYQMWLVERIMRDGYIWAGKGCPHVADDSYFNEDVGVQGEADDESSKPERSILQRALTKQILAMQVRRFAGESFTDDAMISTGHMVEFASSFTPHYNYDDGVRQHMAAFDVDGECMIAIPLDRYIERLPHPCDRAMRVCWVVEPAPMEEKDFIILKEKGKFPEPEPEPEELKGDGTISSKAEKKREREVPFPTESWVLPDERYRVQDKVKGVWPIIENMTRGCYLFV